MLSRMLSLSFFSAFFLISQVGAADSVIPVTQATFYELLAKADKPVILDVYATWCGPCKRLAPIFESFAAENEGRYVCAKLDGGSSKELAASLGVGGYPTVLVFRDKKCIGKTVGFREAQPFKEAIDSIINLADKDVAQLTKEELTVKFQEAVQAGYVEEARKFIEAGADLNVNLPDGMPPLMRAFFNVVQAGDKALPMVDLLISKNASLQGIVSPIDQKTVSTRDFVIQMIQSTKTTYEAFAKILTLIDAKAEEQKCSADECKA